MMCLPVYQIPRYDSYLGSSADLLSCSLKVVDIGAENMGLFISKGYGEEGGEEKDTYQFPFHFQPNEFTYIDSLGGLKLSTFPCVGHVSMYEMMEQLDQKLKRFAFDDSVTRRLRADVERRVKEQEIQAFKKRIGAKKIQRKWREVISNPSFKICKKRLAHEFEELQRVMKELQGVMKETTNDIRKTSDDSYNMI